MSPTCKGTRHFSKEVLLLVFVRMGGGNISTWVLNGALDCGRGAIVLT